MAEPKRRPDHEFALTSHDVAQAIADYRAGEGARLMGSKTRRLRVAAGTAGLSYQAQQRSAARAAARAAISGRYAAERIEFADGNRLEARGPKGPPVRSISDQDALGAPFEAEAIDLKIAGKSIPQMAEPETTPAPRRLNRAAVPMALATLLAMASLGAVDDPKEER